MYPKNHQEYMSFTSLRLDLSFSFSQECTLSQYYAKADPQIPQCFVGKHQFGLSVTFFGTAPILPQAN